MEALFTVCNLSTLRIRPITYSAQGSHRCIGSVVSDSPPSTIFFINNRVLKLLRRTDMAPQQGQFYHHWIHHRADLGNRWWVHLDDCPTFDY